MASTLTVSVRAVPQLDAIGIVSADLARTRAFYRPPRGSSSARATTTSRRRWPNGLPPDGRHRGRDPQLQSRLDAGKRQPARLAFACDSPAEVDEVYARVVEGRLRWREGAVGRFLGSPVRTAPRSRRRRGRPVRGALISSRRRSSSRYELRLELLRPPSAEELIDEAAFDEEEFLPYWAELWPSGLALARHVAARDLRGPRVLELGCGLGLPALAAALRGADVLATDWAEDAIELLRRNAERNGVLAARRPRSLERAGALAPRGSLGSRPRRRPALRGAQRRPARSSSSRASAARCCSPSRGGRTRRSSSSGSEPSPSVAERSTGWLGSLLSPCSPSPSRPRSPSRRSRTSSGSRSRTARPEGRDGRIRREALRHPLLAPPPEGDRRALHRQQQLLRGVEQLRREHARPGARRASRHLRALHRRPERQDLPARAPERHVPPHRRAQLRRRSASSTWARPTGRSCTTRPRSAPRSRSRHGSSTASTSASAT